MVDAKGAVSAEAALRSFYRELIEALPINVLVVDFYANNLLTDYHKSKIDSLGAAKKAKTEYFLDEVIKPGLTIGYTGLFNKMITIMESNEDPVANYLAKEIKIRIPDVSSKSDDDTGNC